MVLGAGRWRTPGAADGRRACGCSEPDDPALARRARGAARRVRRGRHRRRARRAPPSATPRRPSAPRRSSSGVGRRIREGLTHVAVAETDDGAAVRGHAPARRRGHRDRRRRDAAQRAAPGPRRAGHGLPGAGRARARGRARVPVRGQRGHRARVRAARLRARRDRLHRGACVTAPATAAAATPPRPEPLPIVARIMERPAVAAVAGALTIAFSAILVRLADVAPSTAAIFRCAYALPVLGLLAGGRTGASGRGRRACAGSRCPPGSSSPPT